MDTNQPRPVTPQPPQGGGGSGFSAILTVFLSFISIFAMHLIPHIFCIIDSFSPVITFCSVGLKFSSSYF
uniref:Transmembrane protein n=1 Tax=Quercus lobata TaxID=97700 RepID=A0A7N2R232_QUELO